MHLRFVEVLFCGGNNTGQTSMLISIEHTHASCLYICTSMFSDDKAQQWGRWKGIQ